MRTVLLLVLSNIFFALRAQTAEWRNVALGVGR